MTDPLLTWIAAACIATLFAHAAVSKWAGLAVFGQHLAAWGVQVPGALWAVPALETLAAVGLVTPWRGPAALLAASLLLAYAGAMAVALLRHRRLDCGCGGEPLPVSWWLVGRNVLLAALAGASALPAAPRALALPDLLVVAAALLLAVLLHAALHEVLRHRAGPRNVYWRG